VLLQIEPETVLGRSCAVVSAEDVVGVGDPEAGWRLVSVKEAVGGAHVDHEVVLDAVVGLNGVLKEDSVAHCLVGNVARDGQVVDSMQRGGPVVGLVDGVVLDVGLVHVAEHVEMNRVACKLEGLTNIEEFTVLDLANRGFIAVGAEHDLGTILVLGGSLLVTSEDDVPGQKTDFGTHLKLFIAKSLNASVMLVQKCISELDLAVARCRVDTNVGNHSFLGMGTVEVGGGNDNLIAMSPVESISRWNV